MRQADRQKTKRDTEREGGVAGREADRRTERQTDRQRDREARPVSPMQEASQRVKYFQYCPRQGGATEVISMHTDHVTSDLSAEKVRRPAPCKNPQG